MNNWQVLLTAFGLVLTLIVAILGITERNTTRLIEQIEKRMGERDEKLLAKIDGLRAEMKGELQSLRSEMLGESRGLRAEMKGELGVLRADVNHLSNRVEQMERRLFSVSMPS